MIVARLMYRVLPARLHRLVLLPVELKEGEGYSPVLSKMRSTNGSKRLAEVVRIFLLLLLYPQVKTYVLKSSIRDKLELILYQR